MEDIKASEARIEQAKHLNPGAHVHFIGVCGTGMASAAILAKTQGFFVSGSDQAFYPPMGEFVRNSLDRVYTGYNAENLSAKPDLVVVGNAIRANNPEAQALSPLKLNYASMPEFLRARLIREADEVKTSIVVAGTHGKTTTSSALASVLDYLGFSPGFFIGGMPLNFNSSARDVDLKRPVTARVVILEGDEYDSAYFAKWPKFLSYRPTILVLTNLEFDHADIYESLEEIKEQFLKLIKLVPADGVIIACAEDANLSALLETFSSEIKARVHYYGKNAALDYVLTKRSVTESSKLEFKLKHEAITIQTQQHGEHNALNLLAVAAVCHELGVKAEQLPEALAQFKGVKRRQETLINSDKVTLIEDFAHHPTEVRETIRAIRDAYPKRRLHVVFEPRSNTSRRHFFYEQYLAALSLADNVTLKDVPADPIYSKRGGEIHLLNVSQLATQLNTNGVIAKAFAKVEEIHDYLKHQYQSGDVIVIMSNGSFEGLAAKLKTAFTASQ